jgi:hypothetical protein
VLGSASIGSGTGPNGSMEQADIDMRRNPAVMLTSVLMLFV